MDYQALLHRHDSLTHSDWKRTRPRIARCAAELGSVFGADLGSEWGTQDANFCYELCLPLESGALALIRFSCFGEMVSVSDEEPVPDAVLGQLQQMFAQHGFVYVPAAVLNTPYTGCFPYRTIHTWWDRYFDYY